MHRLGVRQPLLGGAGRVQHPARDKGVSARVHSGDIVVDGDERPNDGDSLTLRFGPNEPPDVIINATVSFGELRIDRHEVVGRRLVPEVPEVPED